MPGIEPGTSRTQIENHTTRPQGQHKPNEPHTKLQTYTTHTKQKQNKQPHTRTTKRTGTHTTPQRQTTTRTQHPHQQTPQTHTKSKRQANKHHPKRHIQPTTSPKRLHYHRRIAVSPAPGIMSRDGGVDACRRTTTTRAVRVMRERVCTCCTPIALRIAVVGSQSPAGNERTLTWPGVDVRT